MAKPNLYLNSDWSDDNRILQYAIYSANTSMMQQWRESVLSHLHAWSKDDSPRFLFDLSYPNVSMSYFVLSHRELFNMGITSDGKSQFLTFLDAHPDTDVKLAVVLSSTMLGALSNYIPTNYGRHNFIPRIFFSREIAEDWLQVQAESEALNTNSLNPALLLEVMQDTPQSEQDIYGDRDYLRILVNESLEHIPITDGQPITVGRALDADLDLAEFGPSASSVSRRHAQITLSNGRLSIIDLDSRNGTFVDNQQIPQGKPVFIRRNDVIRIGNVEFSVMF